MRASKLFNIELSHEGQNFAQTPSVKLRHSPDKVFLPPYSPDIPEMRHDWAQYYDKVEDMDKVVGKLLNELYENGETENTIVMYYGDNGGILPRSKRFVYETGTRIPFIVRFPEKFKYLYPAEKPGQKVDRIINFVDFVPTLQHVEYLFQAPSAEAWFTAFKAGKTNLIQSFPFQTKPVEELYDSEKDPWEVNNLAGNPAYATVLERMRKVQTDWMRKIRDVGLIPEADYTEFSLMLKIGCKLAELRKAKKISSSGLARELKISRNAYHLIETGKTYFNLLSLLLVLDYHHRILK